MGKDGIDLLMTIKKRLNFQTQRQEAGSQNFAISEAPIASEPNRQTNVSLVPYVLNVG
jgi:hypothetical protein